MCECVRLHGSIGISEKQLFQQFHEYYQIDERYKHNRKFALSTNRPLKCGNERLNIRVNKMHTHKRKNKKGEELD